MKLVQLLAWSLVAGMIGYAYGPDLVWLYNMHTKHLALDAADGVGTNEQPRN